MSVQPQPEYGIGGKDGCVIALPWDVRRLDDAAIARLAHWLATGEVVEADGTVTPACGCCGRCACDTDAACACCHTDPCAHPEGAQA